MNAAFPGPGSIDPQAAYPAWPHDSLRLGDFRGRWLVLYFYPRDNTPGCTIEACEFRDASEALARLGAAIVGVSRDSLDSHRRFASKQDLPFPLIADTDERLCSVFDVVRTKNMYGRKVRGIERSTFLLDPQGIVRRQWRKVRARGHAAEVLAALQDLQRSG